MLYYFCLKNESWFKKQFPVLNQILHAQHKMDVSFISGHYSSISAGHNFRESCLAYAEQNNLSLSWKIHLSKISSIQSLQKNIYLSN